MYDTQWRIGVSSYWFCQYTRKKHRRLELNNWFECYIVSDEVGVSKPNAEFFSIAVDEIVNKRKRAIEKETILMVGDSIISDGYGAKNFGIDYCFINNQSITAPAHDLPITYIISSVAQLPICMGYQTEYAHFLKAQTALPEV